MASRLNITEFSAMGTANGGAPQIVAMPPLATQNVAIATETDSAALNASTKYVRLKAYGADCSIRIGTGNPTADVNDFIMNAGDVEWLGVQPGSIISVILTS